MTDISGKWRDARTNPPPIGQWVRAIYEDGMELVAYRDHGRVYYPSGGNDFERYCGVTKWCEIGS